MVKNETARIAFELEGKGYCRTSFEALELLLDTEVVDKICNQAPYGNFGKDAAELTKHVEKKI